MKAAWSWLVYLWVRYSVKCTSNIHTFCRIPLICRGRSSGSSWSLSYELIDYGDVPCHWRLQGLGEQSSDASFPASQVPTYAKLAFGCTNLCEARIWILHMLFMNTHSRTNLTSFRHLSSQPKGRMWVLWCARAFQAPKHTSTQGLEPWPMAISRIKDVTTLTILLIFYYRVLDQ